MRIKNSELGIWNYKTAGIALLVLFCLNVTTLFANNLADSAAKAYQRKEYKLSISLYEKILAEGQTSANLYYNLGNAYFKNEALGKAIYNYELAKKLNPTDEDIKNNLRIANSKLIDKIDSKENYFVGAIKSGVYALFSTTGWAWLTISTLFIALLFFSVFIVSGNLILKRASFWLGSLSVVAFFISFAIGVAALHNLNKRTQAVVTSEVIQVLNAPDATGKPKFSLHEGTKLIVLSSTNEWASVQLANGNEGWVRTQELGLF